MKRPIHIFLIAILFSFFSLSAAVKEHLVKDGETFESIAEIYGITVTELKNANPYTKQCFTGIKLNIPSKDPVNSSSSQTEVSPKASPQSKNQPESKSLIESSDIRDRLLDRLLNDEAYQKEYEDFMNRKIKEMASLQPREFEGSLLYTGYLYANNLIRKFSFGQGFNGNIIIEVTIKDNRIHINDRTLHHHLIIEDNGDFVYYNDVSKKGLKGDKMKLKQYFGGIMENHSSDINITKNELDQPIEYNGDYCKVVNGVISGENSANTDYEYWYSTNFITPENYKYVFPGFWTSGLIKKGIQNTNGKVPILGSLKATYAYELEGVTEYPVPDSEFEVPGDVKIENFTKNSQIMGFLRGSSKELKKQNLNPKGDAKEIKLAIADKWNLGEEYLKNPSFMEKMGTWLKTGESLLNGVVSVMDIVDQFSSIGSDPNSTAYDYEEGNSDGPQLSISALIADQRSLKERYERVAGSDAKKTFKRDVEDYDKCIAWLSDLQRSGRTTISQAEWDEYNGRRMAASDERHANRMNIMAERNNRYKRLTESFAKSNYNAYESTLSNWSTSPNYRRDYDYGKVKDMQRYMKNIRNQYGGKKSKWEDWNGY